MNNISSVNINAAGAVKNAAGNEAAQLEKLKKAENGDKDAVGNFNLIKDSLKKGESLERATDEFIGVLKSVGNGSTEEARQLFGELREVPAEKRPGEMSKLFKLIDAIPGSNKAFSIDAYKAIQKISPEKKRDKAFKDMEELVKAENGVKDAVGNFTYIHSKLDGRHSTSKAVREFNQVLDKVGNGSTEEARQLFGEMRELSAKKRPGQMSKLFKLIDAIPGSNKAFSIDAYKAIQKISPEKKRDKAFKDMEELVKAENGVKDAVGNFTYIHSKLDGRHSTSKAVREFNQVLDKVGNGNTEEARHLFGELRELSAKKRPSEMKKLFKLIDSIPANNRGDASAAYHEISGYEKPADRKAAFEAMDKLLSAENGVKDAAGNFKFIKGVVGDEPSKINDSASTFNQILNKVGNGNTKETREIFQNFRNVAGNNPKRELTLLFDLLDSTPQDQRSECVEAYREVSSYEKHTDRKAATECMKELIGAENGAKDATGNFKFIKGIVGDDLKEIKNATGQFNQILKRVGNGNTSDAREQFKTSVKTEQECIATLVKAENSKADAMDDLTFLKSRVGDEPANLREATGEFTSYLKMVGNDSTNLAKKMYNEFSKIQDPSKKQATIDCFSDLAKVENGSSDALDDLTFLKSRVGDEPANLREAAGEFKSYLKMVGNDNTNLAKKMYNEFSKIQDPEKKQAAIDCFSDLARAENGASDALDDLTFLKSRVGDEPANLREAAGEFKSYLKMVGNDNTNLAKKMYNEFSKIQDPEKKQAAIDCFSDLARAENGASDALDDLTFLKSRVGDEPANLREAAGEFKSYLKMVGNDNTNLAKKMYNEFSKIQDPSKKQATIDCFSDLARAENGASDALDDLTFLKSRVGDEPAKLKKATAQFSTILKKVGNDNTNLAKKQFTQSYKV